MVLFVCFEAREGNGILGQGTMRWGAESFLGAGVFLLLRQNQWAFLILPNSENSPFRSVFKFLVYWFILTETKGVHLLGKKNKSEKKKGKKKRCIRCIKEKTRAKRGNQWDNLVVEAYPYWLYAVNLSLRTAAKGKPASF